MGQHKYIRVPKQIVIKDLSSKEPICFDEDGRQVRPDATGAKPWTVPMSRFLSQGTFSTDPRWTRSAASMKAAVAIQMAFDQMEGDVVKLIADDWKELKEALEKPRYLKAGPMGSEEVPGFGGFPGFVLQQFVPFIEAIEEAKERPPEEAPAPEPMPVLPPDEDLPAPVGARA